MAVADVGLIGIECYKIIIRHTRLWPMYRFHILHHQFGFRWEKNVENVFINVICRKFVIGFYWLIWLNGNVTNMCYVVWFWMHTHNIQFAWVWHLLNGMICFANDHCMKSNTFSIVQRLTFNIEWRRSIWLRRHKKSLQNFGFAVSTHDILSFSLCFLSFCHDQKQ